MRHRGWIWIAFAGLASGMLSLTSGASSPSADFHTQWGATELIRVPGPEGEIQGRIYERFVHHALGSYSVGSVSYFRFPKAEASFSSAAVAELLRQGMGFK